MVELYHLCAPERFHLQVSHVTSLLVVATPSHFSRTTARSTWTGRPSPRRHHTQNNFLMSPNQKLQQTQSSRKVVLKNHSDTLTMRVPETCATTLPHKKRFQFCSNWEEIQFVYLRAIQGHSGENSVDPSVLDTVLIPDCFEFIHHVGSVFNLYSITQSGLIAGGATHGRDRETVFSYSR